MTKAELRLDNQVCFALYRASRSIIQMYRPVLDELGLTYPQYLVMLVLWEQEPITMRALGERLDLDSGTLTPLLKRLQTAGLVSRGRNADDERSVVVELTAKGRALRLRAEDIPRRLACATELTADELVALRSTLTDLATKVSGRRLPTTTSE